MVTTAACPARIEVSQDGALVDVPDRGRLVQHRRSAHRAAQQDSAPPPPRTGVQRVVAADGKPRSPAEAAPEFSTMASRVCRDRSTESSNPSKPRSSPLSAQVATCRVRPRCRDGIRRLSPSSSRNNVVLPEPLTPTRPIRWPGPMDQVRSRSSTRGGELGTVMLTRFRSKTSLPNRRVASCCSSSRSRGGGSSAISLLAASIRNRLLVRAGGPRRSRPLLRSGLSPFAIRRLPGPFVPGQHERR